MVDSVPARIVALHLKQFRCFADQTFGLDAPLVYIVGSNGSGKTSIVEALHYACYVRSFRTPSFREIYMYATDSFFVKLSVRHHGEVNDIQVGTHDAKRLIKVNQQRIEFHKDLLQYYRAITITEDSLDLVKEGPIERRSFLDQALALKDIEYVSILKSMQATLETRNAALHFGECQHEIYEIWTMQLWERTSTVQLARIAFLKELEQVVQALINNYFDAAFSVFLTYTPKKMGIGMKYIDFRARNPSLRTDELRFKRSLFGAHLDDVSITLGGMHARHFASRGQQKLITVLVKAAYAKLLTLAFRGPIVLLIDDFMTDFDHARITAVMRLLYDLNVQLIFTSPIRDSFFEGFAKELCADTLSLCL